ncbi:hypothetical protein PIB30_098002, partial [Stylosanthes scabra]|nr:hypothetical protein [Stylosanthes scabra]
MSHESKTKPSTHLPLITFGTPNVTTMLPKANLQPRLALPNVSHPTPKREPPQVLNVTCSLKHEQAFIKCDMLPQGHKVSNVTSPFAHLSFPNVTSCQANEAHSILSTSPSRAPCFDS